TDDGCEYGPRGRLAHMRSFFALRTVPIAFRPDAKSRVPDHGEQQTQRHKDVMPVTVLVELARRKDGGNVPQPAGRRTSSAATLFQVEQEPHILREEQPSRVAADRGPLRLPP